MYDKDRYLYLYRFSERTRQIHKYKITYFLREPITQYKYGVARTEYVYKYRMTNGIRSLYQVKEKYIGKFHINEVFLLEDNDEKAKRIIKKALETKMKDEQKHVKFLQDTIDMFDKIHPEYSDKKKYKL